MKRRLFTMAAALSLLMLAGVAVLWVRSHWTYDMIGNHKRVGLGLDDRSVWSCKGRLGYVRLYWQYAGPTAAQDWSADQFSKWPPGRYHVTGSAMSLNRKEAMGFHFSREANTSLPFSNSRVGLHVPYWFLLLLFAVLPARWAWVSWRRRDPRGFEIEPAGKAEFQ